MPISRKFIEVLKAILPGYVVRTAEALSLQKIWSMPRFRFVRYSIKVMKAIERAVKVKALASRSLNVINKRGLWKRSNLDAMSTKQAAVFIFIVT